MNAPQTNLNLQEDQYSLAKRIPDMERGFAISTNYGDITINADESEEIIDAVREVLEARIEANTPKEVLPGTFITVPEITLPNGLVVPSFRVGQYHATRREDGTPWVEINYHDSRSAAERAGLNLITETQQLAIAHDIAQQPINWTSGVVGEGRLFQGMRKGNVDEVQPHSYESEDADERRWHELSNGERIYDFAGHVYSWVFDDVQGDEKGLIAKRFEADSPSLTTAPGKSMGNGVGWMPNAGANWSGRALRRGGFFNSGGYAGVFRLYGDWPDGGSGIVGFRCTKSL